MPEQTPTSPTWPQIVGAMVLTAVLVGVLLGGVLPMIGIPSQGTRGVGLAVGLVGGLLIARRYRSRPPGGPIPRENADP